MVSFESSYNDDKLRELQRKAEELGGSHEYPLEELMTEDFMSRYTDFQTLQAMFDASGIVNIEEITNDKFLEFISAHTRFASWEEMKQMAAAEYVKRKLAS